MQKIIAPLLFTCSLVLISQVLNAQNTTADTKPAVSKLKSESGNSAPAIKPQLKKDNEEQNSKPIVPGGEFKPMDTRVTLATETDPALYYKTAKAGSPEPPKADPPAPAPAKKEIKKLTPVLQQH